MTDAGNDPNAVVSKTIAEEAQQDALAAVEEYWTAERLAEAEPIAVDVAPGDFPEALFDTVWQPEGDRRSAEPFMPEGIQSAGSLGLDGAIAGYETVRVPDRSRFPYSAVGKLFMTFNGTNYVGSAWVVGERAIFTAAHCIFDEKQADGWADRVLFIPQYYRGEEPVGRWAVIGLHTLRGWTANGEDKFKYDMGAGFLDRPISDRTGSFGWLANVPPDQGPYQSIGFPARYLSSDYPFDGREMWRCNGRYLSGSNPVQMANNMTQGCSGGPWVSLRDGTIYATGLNSFRWNTQPETMNSPYFGTGFLNLIGAIS
jgi:V8-like Glu-specific endopeptidase